jgi:hypothetical protein
MATPQVHREGRVRARYARFSVVIPRVMPALKSRA